MNWKEAFDRHVGWLVDDKQGGWTTGRKQLLDFISTEIIEKLIADIPDEIKAGIPVIEALRTRRNEKTKRVNIKPLKQQLKSKWL
jgi:hypothetical protein